MMSLFTKNLKHQASTLGTDSHAACVVVASPAKSRARVRPTQRAPRNIHVKVLKIESDDTSDSVSNTPYNKAPVVSVETVKTALLDSICSTDRGLAARSEVRAEVNELINQLEVKGGQGADVSSVEFGGTWELLYTNATDLLALLSVSKLPLSPIKIGAITQTIDASSGTLENSVQLEFSLMQTSLSTVSNYNIASPKRLQFTVQRGILHTPSIEGNLELPASVTLMGQTLDLAPLRDILAPVTRGAASLAASATDLLGQAPNLEVPLQTQTWQLTTYLDSTLRITRGDGGAVYVFKKTEANPTKKA
ncbi:hypothetical protein Vretimale_15653 [Volvox reticuliferus]|uniref:Plastid lipid-associated protein/fibrillin conserved domain-containing protein n=1 Tax=Volvox reticuliferus TaxID=1737510 RepID=A0A8J4CNH2_9CHLO|nr:hypothetical protein Vretifemale_14992 [Volvox reticuliferus]GIM12275.1 hypothetical protein Vretimale_15653 [Volvox reticuliferus]